MYFNYLEKVDPEVVMMIKREASRQENKIELIASENFTSPAVMEACGSVLTNKYAEGYPGKRYYGGCEHVDEVETLAIERAKKLFGAEYANVQPHSGANANIGTYFALLTPGDTVLGMDLSNGGHLTHGSPVNMSGKYFDFISYGVDEKGFINYEDVEKLAKQHKPKLIVAGASAYARAIDFKAFREIADKTGAKLMVDMAHIAGLVAAGLHQNPVEYADVVTTTTHKTLRGPRGGAIFTCDEEIAKSINKAIFPGIQGGPLMHIIAGKAVCFKEAAGDDFKKYQKAVIDNAAALVVGLKSRGFKLVSGGTDNHLILLDLSDKDITGKEAEKLLDLANITTNKNTIPNDPNGPFVTSGIRIGTPASTTRGFNEQDMDSVAEAISLVINTKGEEAAMDKARDIVKNLCDKYPLY